MPERRGCRTKKRASPSQPRRPHARRAATSLTPDKAPERANGQAPPPPQKQAPPRPPRPGASRLEILRAKADADQRRAAADTLRLAISSLERDQRTKDSDRTTRITQFSREVTQLDGDIRTAEATLARLAHTIDQTRVRAPITEHLGEVATLQPGAVVPQGDTRGVVLPAGA